MTQDLLIVGAGGFARETASTVEALGDEWRLLGFLDDDPALQGTTRSGVPILGATNLVHEYPAAKVVVCVGNPRNYAARQHLVRRLDLPEERYATIVHPSAAIGSGCAVGPGSVVLAHVAATADVHIGAHVAVMPHAVLTHDDVVGDFATIASGVRLGGGAHVHTGAYLGAGSLIREGVTIGAWSLVGLGSVVLADVPSGQTWVGNPARFLRFATSTPIPAVTKTANNGS